MIFFLSWSIALFFIDLLCAILTRIQQNERKGSECLRVLQNSVFWVLGIACLICSFVIVILLLSVEGTGEEVAFVLLFVFEVCGLVLLLFSRKTLTIYDDHLIYRPAIGHNKSFTLKDIQYVRQEKEFLLIFDQEQKKICRLNYLMLNYEKLLDFLEHNKVEIQYAQ